jgi:3'(2'), 5'-bisphosphate nucleotidase
MDTRNQKNCVLPPSELTTRVIEVVNLASEVLLKYFHQILNVEYKKDEFDPVTIADQESDSLLRIKLQELFPHDQILTEESTDIPTLYDGRVWMVDPLDGTKDFIRGCDGFSINIGLLENGKAIFGCVAVPARGQLFYAEKGIGSFEKTKEGFQRLKVTDVTSVSEARLVTRNPNGEIRPIEEKINLMTFKERIQDGGIGTKLSLIASGKAEAHINTNFRASKWDTLGPQLILEEAGGMLTDFDGNQLDYQKTSVLWERSFVASNNEMIHSEILKWLDE